MFKALKIKNFKGMSKKKISKKDFWGAFVFGCLIGAFLAYTALGLNPEATPEGVRNAGIILQYSSIFVLLMTIVDYRRDKPLIRDDIKAVIVGMTIGATILSSYLSGDIPIFPFPL